jgi:hypothetical protein
MLFLIKAGEKTFLLNEFIKRISLLNAQSVVQD